MTTPPLPGDSLAAIATEVWLRLARGAADRRAAFSRMQVGTLTAQGWPDIRTVILRGADEAGRKLSFHTDRRSAKAGEIAADGRVALHLWDPQAEVQVRLWGQAAVETEGAEVEAAWARLAPRLRARRCHHRALRVAGAAHDRPPPRALRLAEGLAGPLACAVTPQAVP